ncbi:MAG: response regulator transcription factor [Clostridia bacterium]|nr:response regulator transcription factor [Clostridia bacterium]
MKILVIERKDNITMDICKLFTNFAGGSDIETENDLDKGIDKAVANRYDLVIIPYKGAKTVIRNAILKLRLSCSTPLIVISNDTEVSTIIDYLYSGADVCLPYQYNEEQLLAVAHSLIRRSTNNFVTNKYIFKNLEIDFFEKTVKINGEDIGCVAKMYDCFEYLVRHKDLIISKTTLFNRVWGFESETIFSVVEVYISKLRSMLKGTGLDKYLKTIKNAGYTWTEKE